MIVIRQAVSPRLLSCPACGLKLHGYADLDVAGVGGQYTRKTEVSPDEYYGLIDPNDAESLAPYAERYAGKYLQELQEEGDYDNE